MMLTLVMLAAVLSVHARISATEVDTRTLHAGWKNPQTKAINLIQAQALVAKMSLEEKVGQLLMMPVPIFCADAELPKRLQAKGVDIGLGDLNYLKHLFQEYHVGGLIFLYRGTMAEQVATLREFLALAPLEVPLMVAQDLEPGLCEAKSLAPGLIALKDLPQLPCAARLGQMDDEAVYQAGKTLAQQAKSLGVNVIFAPVVDVNSNPKNPIINKRSFGSTAEIVTQKAGAFMDGLRSENIQGVIKHFPGHGDTDADSHYKLPVLKHDMQRLNAVELAPFKACIERGATGVMIAHLVVQALDTKNPASLSAHIMSFLQQELHFKGLIFTDAMDMKALDRTNSHMLPELQALYAGAHIIVVPHDLAQTHKAIVQAVKEGVFSEAQLNERVAEVVAYKLLLEPPCPESR